MDIIGRRDEQEEKEAYSVKRSLNTVPCKTQTLQISELNFYLWHFHFTLIGYLKHAAFYGVKHQISASSDNMNYNLWNKFGWGLETGSVVRRKVTPVNFQLLYFGKLGCGCFSAACHSGESVDIVIT